MKTALILGFILLLMSFHSKAQQTIDKLNTNQLKLPKESVSKALILDATGQVKSSSNVTDTEVGYLDGLTDTLVNLLSGKANDADVVKLTPNQTVSGIKTFDGKLVTSSTTNGSIPCPGMTQTQRNALTPANGECVYNTTSLKLNIYDGSAWKDVGGAGGISLWATSTVYAINDVVIQSDKIYICLIAHTSGTFASDLSSGYWNEISKVITAKSKNTSSLTIDELQIPNNQLVQTSTNKYYVETGNKNILTNPSFEHSSVISGWTNSAGGAIANNTGSLVIDGNQSVTVALSSQAMDLYQDSTLYNAEFNGAVQGLATVRVNTTVSGVRVCSRTNGTVNTSNCVNVVNNGKWGLYKIPFILAFGSNGISINTAGVTKTGNINVDDAFVGAVDLQASVDASKVAGESYFAGISTCNWSRTSTTIGAFTAAAACPGPTVNYSSMGSWQTTDSDLPRQTINNLPAGVYKVKFLIRTVLATSGNSGFAINDGTTTCEPQYGQTGGIGQYTGLTVECTFNYNSAGNRVFELYAGSSVNAITVSNDTASSPRISTKFILEYFGNSSVYTSTNADTDWASCGLTGAAFTGFGSSVPTPSLQCKRQGSDLLIKGTFQAGTTPTAVEARMALPVWNGVQLVSAGSSVIPSVQNAGKGNVNNASVTFFSGITVLIEPSVSYVTFGLEASSASGATKQTGSAIWSSGLSTTISARIPIEGWQGSNIIVGSFSGLQNCTDSFACTDTFSAKISAAGIVSDENIDWIVGNASVVSTSNYTLTLKSGLFTVAPNCSIVTGQSTLYTQTVAIASTGATSVNYVTSNANTGAGTGGAAAYATQIICQKQGADYVGKTALAVASDQNVRSIGSTGVDIQSVYFAGASTTTVCSTSPCTIFTQVGSKITSVTRSAAGSYLLNGIDGTKYNCTGSGFVTTRRAALHDKAASTATYAVVSYDGVDTGYNSIICIGIP